MKTKTKKKLIKVLKELAKALFVAIATAMGITLNSCGVTKATISKPAEGTQTTITITTNNPMHTEINPNVKLNQKEK